MAEKADAYKGKQSAHMLPISSSWCEVGTSGSKKSTSISCNVACIPFSEKWKLWKLPGTDVQNIFMLKSATRCRGLLLQRCQGQQWTCVTAVWCSDCIPEQPRRARQVGQGHRAPSLL